MDLKTDIGLKIKQRRKELRLEQVDLCEMADIGSTTLSKLEQGKANITLESLEKLTKVLGLEFSLELKG
ncbi:MAG: transcriptional regulator [Epsilonproteobacteria bacterium]|nr:MAG: transcriptional regulator [Campylobacterota bacterium]